ncbi:MAG: hypothetical protein LBT29_01440 [Flavobacteriaceae bacterium]|jgi:hypothetical protein|nr:hypothetical protein [Flavobacteriaceae bacterium]
MKKYLILLLFCLAELACFAQSVWKATIQPVEANGYYNIELSQQIIALSEKNELSDLTILDEKKQEVPYFLRPVNPIREISHFEAYELKENRAEDSLNIVIVNNPNSEILSRFYILISGADVTKYVCIRGSNDLKNMYIVKQKTGISNYSTGNNHNEMLIVDFPQGNYRYYEITLSNNQKSPLEVLKVGKIQNSVIYEQFAEINLGKFVQKDSSNRKTYIRFPDLSYASHIYKLEFTVKYKADYFRNAQIFDSKRGNLFNFDISSKHENVFFTNNLILYPESFVVIENYNNPPPLIDSIKVYGLKRYVCAYLEKDQTYSLLIGRKDGIAPTYDLEYFQHDIPADIPIIETKNLQSVPDDNAGQNTLWIEKPLFLWSVIIAVGVLLVFVCLKMIRDIKKRT